MKFIITEEQSEKLNHKIKSTINKFGVEHTLNLFDNDIIRNAYIDNPESFLLQFNDLTPVKKSNMLFYTDKNRSPLFYYYTNRESNIFIDYYRIWMFFEEVIGFSDEEIKGVITKWLEDTYNIKGFIPTYYDLTYNIN